MDRMAEIKQTFFVECEDLLEALEAGLMAMSEGGGDSETVNAVFRAVHSIKGGAGAFALNELVRFAHTFETTLDEVRTGRLEPGVDVVKTLLRAADILADLVRAERGDAAIDPDTVASVANEVEALLTSGDDGGGTDDAFAPILLTLDLDESAEEPDPQSGNQDFAIRMRPRSTLYANGNETLLLLRALGALGEIEVRCDRTGLPLLDDLEPERAYLGWTIRLATESDAQAVREVFDFVDGDCELEIGPASAVDLTPLSPDCPVPAAERSVGSTSVPLAEAKPAPEDESGTEAGAVSAAIQPVAAALSQERPGAALQAAAGPGLAQPTIRVDLDRVDRLINLVGELVINQAVLAQLLAQTGLDTDAGLVGGLDELQQLTREIQESVMAIRAQPVKSLFQRMARIVREAADTTGKSVLLTTDGEATEVDKTVIERLADPLTHMIRNAVDHGVETSERRIAAGKPAQGTVHMTASHHSGRVLIEVSDDGAGIDRARVRQIAVERDLIPANEVLTDHEIDNLIFLPGFSTAKTVSSLSGRGVGMDVVKRAIQALGGRVSITSQPGRGSTFSISLPLTLAVLDGMVVRVADQTVIVPLTAIVELLRPRAADFHSIGAGGPVVSVRGDFVPIVDVGTELGYRSTPTDLRDCVILLVESDEGRRSALVVDAIQDQRQVVIKGLEDTYGAVHGIAAATILGDGRIALILDVDTLAAKGAGAPSLSTPSIALAG